MSGLELVGEVEGRESLVRQYRIGRGKNLVYLLTDSQSAHTLLIDPAHDPIGLHDAALNLGLQPTGVVLTHTHVDHMGGLLRRRHVEGVRELHEEARLPVWVHASEAHRVVRHADVDPSDVLAFESGERLPLGRAAVEVLHTPGHSKGSCCFLSGDLLFTGDTLFSGNVGHVELERETLELMYGSLERLRALPGSTRVLPGHDYGDRVVSTIEMESRVNAYFRPIPRDQWLILMGLL